jgi:hypothetical protein
VIMSKTSVRQKSNAGQANPQQQEPDVRRRLETWLDEALEQTFPGSSRPDWTT